MQFSQGGYYRPSLMGGFSFFPPVIKALLISNVVIWFLFDFFLPVFTLNGAPIFIEIERLLALEPLGHGFMPWQLVTYMFMHGGFGHLFFNMLALWMFGMELEHVWGSKKFLTFYLLCGIGGGLTHLLIGPMLASPAPTVGASGAVFGVLLAFGMLFPDRLIFIYFLLPIKAKYFVAIYIGIELFYGITGAEGNVAHFAHLGGAAVGFLFLLAETNLIPVRSWWSKLRPAQPVMGEPRFTRPAQEVQDAKFYDISTGRAMRNEHEITQAVIDAILDKISKGGYQSLSDEEKRILNEASKKIH